MVGVPQILINESSFKLFYIIFFAALVSWALFSPILQMSKLSWGDSVTQLVSVHGQDLSLDLFDLEACALSITPRFRLTEAPLGEIPFYRLRNI